jgi:CRISPR-associated protein Csb1
MNKEILEKFDDYLSAEGPPALVTREHLVPVEGADAVFFPSTYRDIGYNIDGRNRFEDPSAENTVLVDSVGSQMNRIEPMFKETPFSKLVPQITITAGDSKVVNLLEAGHRAADAIARCSELKDSLQAAFKDVNLGNASLLAKIAPTSLVFGVWDSRDTQAKLPRLLASTIRAYNVRKLTRSATYFAPADYAEMDIFTEEERQKAEGDDKNPLSKRGFVNATPTSTHGGVIADGNILRDVTFALAALRLLKADTPENTKKLQRYILGLALLAFTSNRAIGYLRQGTILVRDAKKPPQIKSVNFDGTRKDVSFTDILEYAQAVAADFVVGDDKKVKFEQDKASSDLKGEGVKPTKKNPKKSASKSTPSA